MTVNLPLLARLAERLRPVLDELVFVGGATVELYLTDQAAEGDPRRVAAREDQLDPHCLRSH
jgi:hypothetical protein